MAKNHGFVRISWKMKDIQMAFCTPKQKKKRPGMGVIKTCG